jgi:hypothetical protein
MVIVKKKKNGEKIALSLFHFGVIPIRAPKYPNHKSVLKTIEVVSQPWL